MWPAVSVPKVSDEPLCKLTVLCAIGRGIVQLQRAGAHRRCAAEGVRAAEGERACCPSLTRDSRVPFWPLAIVPAKVWLECLVNGQGRRVARTGAIVGDRAPAAAERVDSNTVAVEVQRAAVGYQTARAQGRGVAQLQRAGFDVRAAGVGVALERTSSPAPFFVTETVPATLAMTPANVELPVAKFVVSAAVPVTLVVIVLPADPAEAPIVGL